MYLIPQNKWNLTGKEPEQSKLLFELWLEKVSAESSFSYELPLHSCYQLLNNLLSIIPLTKTNTISPKNIPDIIDEILDRLKENIWLNKFYTKEIEHIKDELIKAKSSYEDVRVQNRLELILEAFLHTIERDDIYTKQIQAICDLTKTPQVYSTIEKNLDEFLTDLIHAGHSELYLHKWIVREIIEHQKDLLSQTSIDKLRGTRFLGPKKTKSFKVLLRTSANARIPSSKIIEFIELKENIPEKFLSYDLPFIKSSTSRYVVVEVSESLDIYAAFNDAQKLLNRYLSSVRFQKYLPNPAEISDRGIILDINSDTALDFEPKKIKLSRSIFSADKFYAVETTSPKNNKTFESLDKVLYWYEIAQKSPAELKFISLWTALEFLFSVPGYRTLDGMTRFIVPYFGLSYARSVLRDFTKYIDFVNKLWPGEMPIDIVKHISNKDKLLTADYCNILTASCVDENIAKTLEKHPILVRKFYKVRRLNPQQIISGRFTLLSDLERLEFEMILDIKRFYRTRNMLVHGAEIQDRNLDRILRRMEYFISFIIDKLTDAYHYNPEHSLTALHEVFYSSYQFYKNQITQGKAGVRTTVFPHLLYSKH